MCPEEVRRKIAAVGRALSSPTIGGRALRAWAELRRRPGAVLAVVLAAGVLVMVLHWR
jgi:hypothetical protein